MRTFYQYLMSESPDASMGKNKYNIKFTDPDARAFFIINHQYIVGSVANDYYMTHGSLAKDIDVIFNQKVSPHKKPPEVSSNKKLPKEIIKTITDTMSRGVYVRPLSGNWVDGRIWLDNYIIAFWNKKEDVRESDLKLIFDFYKISNADRQQFRIDIGYKGAIKFEDFFLASDFGKQKKTQKSTERIELEQQLINAQRRYHLEHGTTKRYTAKLIQRIQDKISHLSSWDLNL